MGAPEAEDNNGEAVMFTYRRLVVRLKSQFESDAGIVRPLLGILRSRVCVR